ncbi:hypothetical protein ABEB36_008679 [Hypothenemus hampei]|uniref:Lipase n=1 Tax=Hypothenemus hampei TaxID=57062 RepID=A0ABD1EN55_HYPHA
MLRLSVFLSMLYLVQCIQYKNNVCLSLNDYKTIYRNKNCSYNPDVLSSPKLIARRYGYPLETITVTTKDRYILTLHRIPKSANSKSDENVRRPPILMFHGVGGSSAFYMLQGKRSLGFYLSDHGYDVWLGNWRGNLYSNKHVNYSTSSLKYWNFGFHEMAIYDLPACIDLIANRTGEKGNLIYVGHSMGTTVSYIYSSLMRKHAEENLKSIISLAPVAFMGNIKGSFKLLAPFVPLFRTILNLKGFYAIGHVIGFQRALLPLVCGSYPFINICNILLLSSVGLSEKEYQPELLPIFFSYFPSGISVKTLEHYSQIISSNGRFQMYDFGPAGNLQKYNQSTPPEYDLSEISVPVHLFVGSEDLIGDSKDADILQEKLCLGKSHLSAVKHTFPYAHNDFFLGKDLKPFQDVFLRVVLS